MYVADGRILFLKRAPRGDHPLEWCLPGGGVYDGESLEECARREFYEETGRELTGELKEWSRRIKADPPIPNIVGIGAQGAAPSLVPDLPPEIVDFTTFIATGPAFEPKLCDEHVGSAWAPPTSPPEPLHPGCRTVLAKIGADELAIARMMMAGDLTSPQQYQNIWLYDLRISGTGASYRPKHDEYVLRKPENYLNEEFLARCNGLPIVWQHPPKDVLDSKEFTKRIIGTMFLPYIGDGVNHSADEVWGIAKIWKHEAVDKMQEEQLSTSPGVIATVLLGGTITVDGEESDLVVEGKPPLVDHLAICKAGVWDKGKEPSGVRAEIRGDSTMAAGGTEPDPVLKALDDLKTGMDAKFDTMTKRMDAMEIESKADRTKRDDDAKKRDDDARKRDDDAKRADARKRMDAFKFSKRKDDAEGKAEDDGSYKKRHDAEEEEFKKGEEEAGEAKEKAADKAKKARKDAEEEEDKERKDAKARKDAAGGTAAPGPKEAVTATMTKADSADPATASRLDKLEAAMALSPAPITAADHALFSEQQARADEVYQAHGKQAPGPMAGETVTAYMKRLLKPFQAFSPRWKDADLDKISTDAAAFGTVQQQVYADGLAEAARPSNLADGEVRLVERKHPITKLPIYEFVSGGGTFIGGMLPPMQKARFNPSPRGR